MPIKCKEFDVDNAISDYLSGMTGQQVAIKYNITRQTLNKRLNERGYAHRGRSAAQQLKMDKSTPEFRKSITQAAHYAVRGSVRGFDELCRKAIRKQGSEIVSAYEIDIANELAARGIDVIHQKAVGPYNVDVAAFPVAVEVFGGGWHFYGRHIARTEQRIRYLGDSGWHVLMVCVTQYYTVTRETLDYIATYIKTARSAESERREYRVIRGNNYSLAVGKCDDDHISIKPSAVNT
jgi:very-short-patch-repair endonuclease